METNHEIPTDNGGIKLSFKLSQIQGVMVGITPLDARKPRDWQIIEIQVKKGSIEILCTIDFYKENLLKIFEQQIVSDFYFADAPFLRCPLFVAAKPVSKTQTLF